MSCADWLLRTSMSSSSKSNSKPPSSADRPSLKEAMDDLQAAFDKPSKDNRGAGKLAVSYLSRKGAVNAPCPHKGLTPLQMAAKRDSAPCVTFLARWGADLAARGRAEGASTPVMEAARSGGVRALRRLLELGADVDDNGAGGSHLHECAAAGDAAAMAVLLRFGAAVDARVGGRTPLMVAAAAQAEECVELLLGCGADFALKEPRSGCDALHEAVLTPSAGCARMLIRAGADVNSKNIMEMSCLQGAAMAQSRPGVFVLLEAGASLKFLPLHLRATTFKTFQDQVDAVMEWGAKVINLDLQTWTSFGPDGGDEHRLRVGDLVQYQQQDPFGYQQAPVPTPAPTPAYHYANFQMPQQHFNYQRAMHHWYGHPYMNW